MINKTKNTPPLMLPLDRGSARPLLSQIYSAIRQAILDGRLTPGSRLPPTRVLAADLGVSRTIVVFAYERLATEGYVAGRGSAGSFVAELDIGRTASRRESRAPVRPATTAQAPRPAAALTLPAGLEGLPHISAAPRPFRIGEPAMELFPIRLWSQLYGRRARREGSGLLAYGDDGGYRPLRAAIAAYVGAARGVNATAEQVILTRGAQQAIDLIGRVLLRRGESVWVEDPGYLAARALFELAGAHLVPVPVDAEGLDVAAGERAAPQARLAYVSPSHHFPLGAMLSLRRRLALLDWAGRAGAWIVEDDYDSEFRYAGAPISSLQGLDGAQRVIYLGTFSKTVFPALRLGYLIVPAPLAELFQRAQTLLDHIAPNVEQATLAEFIEAGHFTRHVRRMRAEYAARQEALLEAVALELPGLVEAERADTGMHVVGWLRDQALDEGRVSRLAWEKGVEVSPLRRYAREVRLPPGLLMGFSAVPPEEMRPALRILRDAITRAGAEVPRIAPR